MNARDPNARRNRDTCIWTALRAEAGGWFCHSSSMRRSAVIQVPERSTSSANTWRDATPGNRSGRPSQHTSSGPKIRNSSIPPDRTLPAPLPGRGHAVTGELEPQPMPNITTWAGQPIRWLTNPRIVALRKAMLWRDATPERRQSLGPLGADYYFHALARRHDRTRRGGY
jgi:hypothetical protein